MGRKGANDIADIRARTAARVDSTITNRPFHSSKRGGYKSGDDRWQPSKKTYDVKHLDRSNSTGG